MTASPQHPQQQQQQQPVHPSSGVAPDTADVSNTVDGENGEKNCTPTANDRAIDAAEGQQPNEQVGGVAEAAAVPAADDAAGDPTAALGASARRRLRREQQKEERKQQKLDKRSEKRKRQKERRQGARLKMLEAMDATERAAYLQSERDAGRVRKAEWHASLQHAFDAGKPKVVINCSFGSIMDPR